MKTFRLPAEWEPQRAVMLTWPHAATDWLPYLDAITETYLQLADAIAARERLVIATPEPDRVRALLASRLSEGVTRRIGVYECASNDTWARDHGPITLIDDTQPPASQLRRRMLDFRFNGWGEKFPADRDNAISRTLNRQGAWEGCLASEDDFVLEGGSIESDGAGTVMTTSHCLLAPHRNQPMDKAEIGRQLMRRLHAKRIVWLDHGQLLGDDTDGHVDTIARFAPGDTIVYQGCDDPGDPQWEDLQALGRQLATLRAPNGKPYRLLPLPLPPARYDDGDRLPATYANFLVINGAVLLPTYGQEATDRKATDTLRQAFPGREVIGIDARTIVRQHGSIHCLTMQIPE